MAHVVGRPHLTLNTDGRPHPRLNTLILVTCATAIAALVCVFFPGARFAGVVIGAVGWVTGYASQMLSETTAERWVIVPAMILAAASCVLNVGFGGLY